MNKFYFRTINKIRFKLLYLKKKINLKMEKLIIIISL